MYCPRGEVRTLSRIGIPNYETFSSDLRKKKTKKQNKKYNRWRNTEPCIFGSRGAFRRVSRVARMQKKLNGVFYRGANSITKESLYREFGARKESLNVSGGERPIRLLVLAQRRLLPVYKLRVHRLCCTTGAGLTFHSGLA